jgi:multicomponent Na+:H+ antiporter subunit B
MTNRGRIVLFAVGAAGLAVLAVLAVGGLPAFGSDAGPYRTVVDDVAVPARQVSEAVAVVTFDVRGADSLMEEAILFAAATAVALVLRPHPGDAPPEAVDAAAAAAVSETIAVVVAVLVPILALVGLAVVGHGHVTPGGGFQGGVVIAAALVLSYVAADLAHLRRAVPDVVTEPAESTALAAYVVVGLVGLVAGTAFLDDVLPLGDAGSLASGGTVPVLSVAVGLEVTAGVVLVVRHFLAQLVDVRQRPTPP